MILEKIICNGFNSLGGCYLPEIISISESEAYNEINDGAYYDVTCESDGLVLTIKPDKNCDCFASCKGGCNETIQR